jgi:uncharacterized protein YecE (DUF72 family)
LKSTPRTFKFVLKAHRSIINSNDQKKLKKHWSVFWSTTKILKSKLAGVLFEFRANYKNNDNNMDKIIRLSKMIPKNINKIIELRDLSWFTSQTLKKLESLGWTIAIINTYSSWAGNLKNGFNPKLKDYKPKRIFIRMHGSKGKYIGGYSNSTLKKIVKFIKGRKNAIVMFNNTGSLNKKLKVNDSIRDGLRLSHMLKQTNTVKFR